MRLIVGLGNPDAKYAKNRHNVGFRVMDALQASSDFGPWKRRFSALTSEGFLSHENTREKALLLKPQTYYNESGRAVQEAAHFFKIPPENIWVFYDEIDLAPGKFRLKSGGGAAGNNGIKSITRHLGPDFTRARIGVGHPGDKSKVVGYVLNDFPKADQPWLDDLIDAISRSIDLTLAEDTNQFQTRVTFLAPGIKPPTADDATTDK